VLSKLEDVRQTQQWQSTVLQSILRQLTGSAEGKIVQMPEGISFPIKTFDEIDAVEKKLADSSVQKLLVRYGVCCIYITVGFPFARLVILLVQFINMRMVTSEYPSTQYGSNQMISQNLFEIYD